MPTIEDVFTEENCSAKDANRLLIIEMFADYTDSEGYLEIHIIDQDTKKLVYRTRAGVQPGPKFQDSASITVYIPHGCEVEQISSGGFGFSEGGYKFITL